MKVFWLVSLPVLVTFLGVEVKGWGNDRILLKDVQTLTLYDGKMTTGRRVAPIPQLKRVGGSAPYKAETPKVVQCYNQGSDGLDVQWKCNAELEDKYKFGRIEVICEGYEHPDDPYILRGSCALEYELDITDKGKAWERNQGHNWHGNNDFYHHSSPHKKHGPFLNIIVLIAAACVIYAIYRSCSSSSGGDDGTEFRRRGPRGPDGRGPPPPYPGGGDDSPPPPYGWKNSDQSRTEYRGTSTPGGNAGCQAGGARNNDGPGFWTGLGAGGLLGYMMGGNRGSQTYYGHHDPYNRNRGFGNNWGFGSGGGWGSGSGSSSWFGGGGGGSSGFGGGGGASSSSRTASGFGGTRRR